MTQRSVLGRTLLAVSMLGVAQDASLAGDRIPFATDLDAALVTAGRTGRQTVVVFVAAWCPVCREMERTTFRDSSLVALAERYVWVRVDIDRNRSTARRFGVSGVPAVMVLDAEGRPRRTLLGRQSATELERNLADPAPGSARGRTEGLPDRPTSSVTWTPQGYRGSGICFSHVGYGPLRLYSQSPFQSLRMGIRPRTPSTIGKGQYEVYGGLSWANLWGVERDVGDPANAYFVDLETLQTTIALSYGITDTLEIEGEFQNRNRFGGEMDALTQGFHDLFGIDQNGRDEVPQDGFVLDLAPPDAPAVSFRNVDKGTFSRTLQVALQHNLTCGTGRLPAIAYSVSARVDTLNSDDLSGGREVDLGISLSASRRLGEVYLYGTFGYAWFGHDEFRGIPLRDRQLTVLLATEWRFGGKQSFVLQYLRSGGLVHGFGPFASASNEVTLGYKRELRDRGVLEIGLIENIISYDNSPDFGIHAGFSQRFGPSR